MLKPNNIHPASNQLVYPAKDVKHNCAMKKAGAVITGGLSSCMPLKQNPIISISVLMNVMANKKRFTRQFLLAYYLMVMTRKNFLVITMLFVLVVIAWVLTGAMYTRFSMQVQQGSSVHPFFPSLLFH